MYFSSFYVKIDCIFVLVNQLKQINMKNFLSKKNPQIVFAQAMAMYFLIQILFRL